MTIATGTVLAERWELTSRLASGGMGDVYQAQDRRGGDDVAIKVLRSGIMQGEQRFAGEIEMLRRLDHPHVVAVVDAGEQEGMPYLVMELLPGRTLADLLRDGAVDLERVQRIGAAIAAALAYAHSHGIVNRDLKPSNILFAADGTAKLADFGIAKLMDVSGITITGQALGTASYIAPEQLSAPDRVGPATDVYSLGLVLLEAASGRRAFPGSGTEAAMARLARDPDIPSGVSDAWQQLLRAMTAREPGLRPSAAEVAELLAGELDEAAVQTLVVPPARIDDATVPIPVDQGSTYLPPDAGETRAMGKATHGLRAGASAGAASTAASGPVADAASEAGSDAAPTTVSRPARSTPAPRRRRRAVPWILVILLLLVVAAGAVFIVLDLGDDPADDPDPEVPAETDDPPEDAPPADDPEDPDPEQPTDEEPPTEEPEPEPGPEEPAEEPGAPDEPGGGPPDDTPGEGPPDADGAGEQDGSDGALPVDPVDELSDLDVDL